MTLVRGDGEEKGCMNGSLKARLMRSTDLNHSEQRLIGSKKRMIRPE